MANEARRGNPETGRGWSLATPWHARSRWACRTPRKGTAPEGFRGVGSPHRTPRRSRRSQGEGGDSHTQSAKATRAGQRRAGEHRANRLAGDIHHGGYGNGPPIPKPLLLPGWVSISEETYYSFIDSGIFKKVQASEKWVFPYKLKERYRKERSIEIAKAMKQEKVSMTIIAKTSGLSVEEIKKL